MVSELRMFQKLAFGGLSLSTANCETEWSTKWTQNIFHNVSGCLGSRAAWLPWQDRNVWVSGALQVRFRSVQMVQACSENDQMIQTFTVHLLSTWRLDRNGLSFPGRFQEDVRRTHRDDLGSEWFRVERSVLLGELGGPKQRQNWENLTIECEWRALTLSKCDWAWIVHYILLLWIPGFPRVSPPILDSLDVWRWSRRSSTLSSARTKTGSDPSSFVVVDEPPKWWAQKNPSSFWAFHETWDR